MFSNSKEHFVVPFPARGLVGCLSMAVQFEQFKGSSDVFSEPLRRCVPAGFGEKHDAVSPEVAPKGPPSLCGPPRAVGGSRTAVHSRAHHWSYRPTSGAPLHLTEPGLVAM